MTHDAASETRAVRAVLLDVYETLLTVDSEAMLSALAASSGLETTEWMAGRRHLRHRITVGEMSMADGFRSLFRQAGQAPPPDVEALVRLDAQLLRDNATVYPDVVPFLDELATRQIRVALVSNCWPGTREMLDAEGLIARVDHAVLSCEVAAAKPDPAIYRFALDALEVEAGDALFVDDQVDYCSAARELGIRAIRVDRRRRDPESVGSLRDVVPLLGDGSHRRSQ